MLNHLGSAAEIGLNTVTTSQADMDAAKAIWARWNSMSPNQQAEEFAVASRRLSDALEALTDAQLDAYRIDMGFLPAPVNVHFYISMRLGEVGLHGWDVHVPFDGAATVPADLVPYVLDQLPMFAGFFGKPTDRTVELSVKTTAPDRGYRLGLGEDGVKLEQEASDSPNKLALPGESFLRLTSGRLDPGPHAGRGHHRGCDHPRRSPPRLSRLLRIEPDYLCPRADVWHRAATRFSRRGFRLP